MLRAIMIIPIIEFVVASGTACLKIQLVTWLYGILMDVD